MKERNYVLNTALAAVLGLAGLVCILVRTFAPAVILPQLNIPNMVLLSLAALVLDYYLAPGAKRNYVWAALLAALTFGLLPFAGGFADGMLALKLAAVGAVVFPVTTALYTSAADRISTGPTAKAAPILTALGLYLAAQGFAGIIL